MKAKVRKAECCTCLLFTISVVTIVGWILQPCTANGLVRGEGSNWARARSQDAPSIDHKTLRGLPQPSAPTGGLPAVTEGQLRAHSFIPTEFS